ncbi:MAG: Haloalkane dehalogenase [Alphaproteobacteria bacterium MarineAlpha2_Bin1]|nr:MAG: Haloalkane dehalogenase [Alphaproteobacteria bacterium MarineAlpha2_Bin1]
MSTIKKYYLTVNNRRVHYRRSGFGPPLVLLHASPVSSEVFEDAHFPIWQKFFTVIALDTPGQGLSDPLEIGRQPLIEDYADALAETLDVLNIYSSCFYGRHTGASIAVEFARRYPKRTNVVVTDGFPLFTAEKREDALKNYLTEIKPDWTGSYLIWWWFRYREQHIFWPWNKHEKSSRADQDVPELNFLQRGTKELLVAGNNYMNPYRAAFMHEGIPAVNDIIKSKVPVCFGARPGDSIFTSLERMPKHSWTKEFPRDKIDAATEELEIFLKYKSTSFVPKPLEPTDINGRISITYIDINNHQITLRSFGKKSKKTPVILIHDIPGSSKLLEKIIYNLGVDREVIAPDLPGHGDSSSIEISQHSVQNYASYLNKLLDIINVREINIFGMSGGASVATELSHQTNINVKSLMLQSPMVIPEQIKNKLSSNWIQDIELSPNGYHLNIIWHHLRDQQLFFPWYKKTLKNTRFIEPDISEEELHDKLVECIKHIESYKPSWDALFSYPLQKNISSIRTPIWIGGKSSDVFVNFLENTERVTRTRANKIDNHPDSIPTSLNTFMKSLENE